MRAQRTNWKTKLTENLKVSANLPLTETDKTPNKEVSSVSVSAVLADNSQNQRFGFDKSEGRIPELLSQSNDAESALLEAGEFLSKVKAKGCQFELSSNGETFTYPTSLLTGTENEFVRNNCDAIRGVLFLDWLRVNVFAGDPSEQFTVEANERAALMNDDLGGAVMTAWEWWLLHQPSEKPIVQIVRMDEATLQAFNRKWADLDEQNLKNPLLHTWSKATL